MKASSPSPIGRRPLFIVSAALLLAVLPLIGKLTPWVLVLFVAATGWRVVIEIRSARLPGPILRLAIAAAGACGILMQFGTLMGLEAGLGVLMVLSSVKILEARRPRDFLVLVVLGWFLCLTHLFFAQDLLNCIYALGVFLLLTAALLQVYLAPGKSPLPSIRLATVLMLQALPLVLILFLLFPRTYGGFRFQFAPSMLGRTGMSDRLYPGSIASLAETSEIAFRADFRDGEVPTYPSMYWRGAVLWRGNGLNWAPDVSLDETSAARQLGGPGIWQQIVVEPHGDRWLFALDWPASVDSGVVMQFGDVLRARKPVFNSFRYEVVSRPFNREAHLPPYILSRALELSETKPVSPAVRELVAGWTSEGATDRAVVEQALRFFRKEGFRYTLSPGTYSSNALDEFLFERREGFCEHFAGAFATLMRVAGIPARVVVGYQGGEFNRLGNYVIVRQSDAHAWCEIWEEGAGWRRVDPTNAIAPERTTSGLSSYLASEANRSEGEMAARRSEGAIGIQEIFREMRLAWDTVNYQWDLRVLNFDAGSQRALLSSFGWDRFKAPDLLMWMLGSMALFLGALSLGMRRRVRSRPDRVVGAYTVLCRRLARAGLIRDESEGPVSLRNRAVEKFPAESERLTVLFDEYVRLRYGIPGSEEGSVRNFVRAARRFRPNGGKSS